MEITAQLNLSKEDISKLAAILDVEVEEVPDTFSSYASAAIEEIATMVLGQKVFTRGSDILLYRLYLLIQHVFDSQIPSEAEVSKLFQSTSSGSRSMIRSVMSKYQYLLEDAINNSLKSCVAEAQPNKSDNKYIVAIYNRNLVDHLNLLVGQLDSTLQAVRKQVGSAATYELNKSTYLALAKYFKLQGD